MHQGRGWEGHFSQMVLLGSQGCCWSKEMGRATPTVAWLLKELSLGCNRDIIRETQ